MQPSLDYTNAEHMHASLALMNTRITNRDWLPVPNAGILSGMDPETYTILITNCQKRMVEKSDHHFDVLQRVLTLPTDTASSMCDVFMRMMSFLDWDITGRCVGVANIAMALSVVAFMTLPGSVARNELCVSCVGGVDLDRVASLLVDPHRAVLLMTFDSDEHNSMLDGCTTQHNSATKIKEHIISVFKGQAMVVNLPSPNSEAVEIINNFCNDKTNGGIPRIIDELDMNCKTVIVAAESIKVEWETKMMLGSKAVFHSRLPVLDQDYCEYHDTNLFVHVDGESGCISVRVDAKVDTHGTSRSMIFILPRQGGDEETTFRYARKLKMSNFQSTKVDFFSVPVVDIETNTVDGKNLLQLAGVSEVFDNQCSMQPFFNTSSNIGGCVVTRIVHTSRISWNRKGCVAQAATVVEVTYRSVCAASPKGMDIRLNRPFLAILGKVVDDSFLPEFATFVKGPSAGSSCLGSHDPDDTGDDDEDYE